MLSWLSHLSVSCEDKAGLRVLRDSGNSLYLTQHPGYKASWVVTKTNVCSMHHSTPNRIMQQQMSLFFSQDMVSFLHTIILQWHFKFLLSKSIFSRIYAPFIWYQSHVHKNNVKIWQMLCSLKFMLFTILHLIFWVWQCKLTHI